MFDPKVFCILTEKLFTTDFKEIFDMTENGSVSYDIGKPYSLNPGWLIIIGVLCRMVGYPNFVSTAAKIKPENLVRFKKELMPMYQLLWNRYLMDK